MFFTTIVAARGPYAIAVVVIKQTATGRPMTIPIVTFAFFATVIHTIELFRDR